MAQQQEKIGTLGIASSCLTDDFNTIQQLLTPAHDKGLLHNLGWLVTKTLDLGNPINNSHSRIVHSTQPYNRPIFPGSAICRGHDEWLTEEKLGALTKDLRGLFTKWNATTRIKISLPPWTNPTFFPQLLKSLASKGVEFDGVEVPLKYLQKSIRNRMNNSLSLDALRDATVEQYAAALAILAGVRMGLRDIDRASVPIHLKLSMDNWVPDIMALLLLCPNANLIKDLTKSLRDGVLNQLRDISAAQKEVVESVLVDGADAVVLFDSEKFPSFLPNSAYPRSARIPAAEEGYSTKGGAVVGKAMAKDSMKHVCEVRRHLAACATDPRGRLIASGGCDSGVDAACRMILGASEVDICTVLLREGPPGLVRVLTEYQAFLDSHSLRAESIVDLAQLHRHTEETYKGLIPKKGNQACTCSQCTAICWRTGEGWKSIANAQAGCIKCGSCITLCRTQNLKC